MTQLKQKREEIYSDISILVHSGENLKKSLKLFLSKYQIETRQIPRSDADFYFALPENKFCVVEIKSSKNTALDETPFNQLSKWRIDFVEYIRKQNDYDKFNEKNVVPLLIVNNDYKSVPKDRKLIIDNKIKERYFGNDPIKHRVITTFDLFNILTSTNGKERFVKKLLQNDQMQIKCFI